NVPERLGRQPFGERVDGHDAVHMQAVALVRQLLPLRMAEGRAATLAVHLPVNTDPVSFEPVEDVFQPRLAEEDQLRRSGGVADQDTSEQQATAGRPIDRDIDYLAAGTDRLIMPRLAQRAEVAPVLIAMREVKQHVLHGVEAQLLERQRHAWADAFDELQRGRETFCEGWERGGGRAGGFWHSRTLAPDRI